MTRCAAFLHRKVLQLDGSGEFLKLLLSYNVLSRHATTFGFSNGWNDSRDFGRSGVD